MTNFSRNAVDKNENQIKNNFMDIVNMQNGMNGIENRLSKFEGKVRFLQNYVFDLNNEEVNLDKRLVKTDRFSQILGYTNLGLILCILMATAVFIIKKFLRSQT